MFVTANNITNFFGKSSAELLIVTGTGRKATAREAAECMNRYVAEGNPKMHEANEEFKRLYGMTYVRHMCGFNAGAEARRAIEADICAID